MVIQAVVALTKKEFDKLQRDSKIGIPLKVGQDSIEFFAAYYDEQSNMIKAFKPL
jgi:hypothetical protein